jgi:hypothetical protein
MADENISTCYCVDKSCGHKDELRCGKPLSAEATAELRYERERFNDPSLGMCADCFENYKKRLPA